MNKKIWILVLCVGMLLTACSGTPEAKPAIEAESAAEVQEEASPESDKEVATEEESIEAVAPPASPYADTIVFVSTRGGDPSEMKLELFLLDPHTKEVTAVETGIDGCVLPKWSPDGSRILFSTMNIWNLYTVKPDGTDLIQITDFRSNNADWSPDGKQIVFQSDHQDEPQDTPDLYIMDITGENLVEILDDPPNADYSPRWSPDGSTILFISNRSGKEEIFTIQADGSGIQQLSNMTDPVANAEWSPDGTRIAFVKGPPDGENLFIADADDFNANVVQLTSDGKGIGQVAFSPDGKQMIFNSGAELWTINVDGSNLVQLTDGEYFNLWPDWSP